MSGRFVRQGRPGPVSSRNPSNSSLEWYMRRNVPEPQGEAQPGSSSSQAGSQPSSNAATEVAAVTDVATLVNRLRLDVMGNESDQSDSTIITMPLLHGSSDPSAAQRFAETPAGSEPGGVEPLQRAATQVDADSTATDSAGSQRRHRRTRRGHRGGRRRPEHPGPNPQKSATDSEGHSDSCRCSECQGDVDRQIRELRAELYRITKSDDGNGPGDNTEVESHHTGQGTQARKEHKPGEGDTDGGPSARRPSVPVSLHPLQPHAQPFTQPEPQAAAHPPAIAPTVPGPGPSRPEAVDMEHTVDRPTDPRPNWYGNESSGRARVYHGPFHGNPSGSPHGPQTLQHSRADRTQAQGPAQETGTLPSAEGFAYSEASQCTPYPVPTFYPVGSYNPTPNDYVGDHHLGPAGSFGQQHGHQSGYNPWAASQNSQQGNNGPWVASHGGYGPWPGPHGGSDMDSPHNNSGSNMTRSATTAGRSRRSTSMRGRSSSLRHHTTTRRNNNAYSRGRRGRSPGLGDRTRFPFSDSPKKVAFAVPDAQNPPPWSDADVRAAFDCSSSQTPQAEDRAVRGQRPRRRGAVSDSEGQRHRDMEQARDQARQQVYDELSWARSWDGEPYRYTHGFGRPEHGSGSG